MHIYEAMGGEHIANAAEKLVEAAKRHGGAKMKFNDVELVATPATDPDDIVAEFGRETEARAEAYRNSPEGKAAAIAAEEERRAAQATHDALMLQLPHLDFTKRAAVLDWLVAMQPASDRVGVVVRSKTIVETFEAHGFEVGANCGPEFRATDGDNVFRWIVGQALDGLRQLGAIHGILLKFAAEWKVDFHG